MDKFQNVGLWPALCPGLFHTQPCRLDPQFDPAAFRSWWVIGLVELVIDPKLGIFPVTTLDFFLRENSIP